MYETDLEEDDVEAQCRMIFEEFEPDTVAPASDADATTQSSTNEPYDPMAKYDDSGKRKRVAYENAESQHKPLKTSNQNINHVRNAMQSVFRRQEIVRQQMEAKQKKEEEEVAKRQAAQLEAKRKSLEQELNGTSPTNNSTPKLTPLVTPASVANSRYYSKKMITPVSNILAIQKAKEKVEQLRAAKMQQQPHYTGKTIAQTTSKGADRVAHTSTAVATQVLLPTHRNPPIQTLSNNVR